MVPIWKLKRGDLFKLEGCDVILEFVKIDGAYCIALVRSGNQCFIGLCEVELL